MRTDTIELPLLRPVASGGAVPEGVVEVQTLGRFCVFRDGVLIGPSAWQSRKARLLLKILIARQGRPVQREVVAEVLWPDEDPGLTCRRLSVILSTLRSVLDPQRTFPADHFVTACRDLLGLDLAHVRLDVLRFLAHSDAGRLELRGGRRAAALTLLTQAAADYVGDFLPDEMYEEYPAALRERARCAHLAVQRDLVSLAPDYDTAVGHLLRILEHDPYDEDAHIDLVRRSLAARRHGQAHRFHRAYVARMAEIGVDAVPYSVHPAAVQAS